MEELYLEVVTPNRVVVSKGVDIVVAPGSDGEFGILKDHVPFLTGILPGEVRFSTGNETEYLAVSSGFAEVSDNKVSILVDSAELAHEIDLKRAKDAMTRAQERLEKDRSKEEVDFLRAEAALKRAINRIKVKEKAE